MLPAPYVVQRQVYEPGGVDRYNNETASWPVVVDVPVYGWAPASEQEPGGERRTAVVRDVDLFAPAGTVFAPRDRVALHGVVYEVVGHPQDYTTGPFLWRGAGVVVNLNRVEG